MNKTNETNSGDVPSEEQLMRQFRIDHTKVYFDESSSLFYNKEKQRLAVQQYNDLLEFARNDEAIYGVILSGSRGKGQGHQYSDYDLSVIVDQKDIDHYRQVIIHSEQFAALGDAGVASIQSVREGYPFPHWARYGQARLVPPVDKTGELTKSLQQYLFVPKDKQEDVIKGHTSAYVNAIYRSLKSHRSGDLFSSHFMCLASIGYLLTVVFTIHGRETPYPKYLKWEAEHFPLSKLEQLQYNPIKTVDLMDKVETLMKTADVDIQQELFDSIYELLYTEGYGDELEKEWGEDHIRFIQYYQGNR